MPTATFHSPTVGVRYNVAGEYHTFMEIKLVLGPGGGGGKVGEPGGFAVGRFAR